MRTRLGMHGDDVGAGLGEGPMNASQGAIIRCTSNSFLECGRSAFTMSGPMVMFGTKCPSMTSTWIQSQPAW